VLELAAGTGVLTRAIMASLPGARVIATDLNVAMVDVGSARVPAATWRQADAMQLPFGDARVDLVACQFGVMFFPDRPAAYAEVARSPDPPHDLDVGRPARRANALLPGTIDLVEGPKSNG